MKPWAKAAVQGAACGLMFGLVVLIGGRLWHPQVAAAQAKQPAVPDLVNARRFELVDAAGKVRAVLGLEPDGSPTLDLFDPAGRMRAFLKLGPDGSPGLALCDAAQKLRARMVLPSDGRPSLELRDAAENSRATLRLTEEGSPYLALRDKAGATRAVLGVTSLETIGTAEVTTRSESSLVLFDKDGNVIWRAP